MFDAHYLKKLRRVAIQKLAKAHRIPANLSTDTIIGRLTKSAGRRTSSPVGESSTRPAGSSSQGPADQETRERTVTPSPATPSPHSSERMQSIQTSQPAANTFASQAEVETSPSNVKAIGPGRLVPSVFSAPCGEDTSAPQQSAQASSMSHSSSPQHVPSGRPVEEAPMGPGAQSKGPWSSVLTDDDDSDHMQVDTNGEVYLGRSGSSPSRGISSSEPLPHSSPLPPFSASLTYGRASGRAEGPTPISHLANGNLSADGTKPNVPVKPSRKGKEVERPSASYRASAHVSETLGEQEQNAGALSPRRAKYVRNMLALGYQPRPEPTSEMKQNWTEQEAEEYYRLPKPNPDAFSSLEDVEWEDTDFHSNSDGQFGDEEGNEVMDVDEREMKEDTLKRLVVDVNAINYGYDRQLEELRGLLPFIEHNHKKTICMDRAVTQEAAMQLRTTMYMAHCNPRVAGRWTAKEFWTGYPIRMKRDNGLWRELDSDEERGSEDGADSEGDEPPSPGPSHTAPRPESSQTPSPSVRSPGSMERDGTSQAPGQAPPSRSSSSSPRPPLLSPFELRPSASRSTQPLRPTQPAPSPSRSPTASTSRLSNNVRERYTNIPNSRERRSSRRSTPSASGAAVEDGRARKSSQRLDGKSMSLSPRVQRVSSLSPVPSLTALATLEGLVAKKNKDQRKKERRSKAKQTLAQTSPQWERLVAEHQAIQPARDDRNLKRPRDSVENSSDVEAPSPAKKRRGGDNPLDLASHKQLIAPQPPQPNELMVATASTPSPASRVWPPLEINGTPTTNLPGVAAAPTFGVTWSPGLIHRPVFQPPVRSPQQPETTPNTQVDSRPTRLQSPQRETEIPRSQAEVPPQPTISRCSPPATETPRSEIEVGPQPTSPRSPRSPRQQQFAEAGPSTPRSPITSLIERSPRARSLQSGEMVPLGIGHLCEQLREATSSYSADRASALQTASQRQLQRRRIQTNLNIDAEDVATTPPQSPVKEEETEPEDEFRVETGPSTTSTLAPTSPSLLSSGLTPPRPATPALNIPASTPSSYSASISSRFTSLLSLLVSPSQARPPPAPPAPAPAVIVDEDYVDASSVEEILTSFGGTEDDPIVLSDEDESNEGTSNVLAGLDGPASQPPQPRMNPALSIPQYTPHVHRPVRNVTVVPPRKKVSYGNRGR